MQLSSLFEAGIRTAGIETAAGAALRRELPEKVALFVKSITPRLRPPRYPEGHDEEQSDLVDRLDELGRKNKSLFATTIAEIASDILTKVLRNHLRIVASSIPDFKRYYEETCGPNAIEYFVNGNQCSVEVKELSADIEAARCQGYFSSRNALIKIFVDYEVAQSACGDCIMQSIMGEMDGYAFKMFINDTLSTFAHEYAHCEQKMRHQHPQKKSPLKDPGAFVDRTMITPALAGKKRTPKRGGVFRNPEKSPFDRLQYYGSLHEIDAFASGAASDMVSTIERYQSRYGSQPDPNEFNDQIENLKHSLASGYSRSVQATQYLQMLHSRFDREVTAMKVAPKQIEKVWKRFAKILSQKLDDYKMDGEGMRDRDKAPFARYETFISDLAPSQAIAKLATIAARATIEDDDIWGDRVKMTLQGYGRYLEEMERFISYKFFNNKAYEPRFEKMAEIFRRMVARKISDFEAQAEIKKIAA